MKINKYFPFAFIYFFLNSAGLPFGITYMALLGPFFYVWVVLTRKKEVLLPFLAILLPFVFMHTVVIHVEMKTYLLSLLNLILVYCFCQAVYTFFKVCKDPENIFRQLLIINFAFCIIGIVFYFTPYYELFWIQQKLTSGVLDFKRFRLFTYEASYYATVFIPIFLFYLLQYVFRQNKIKSPLLLLMLFLPMVLSFSMGVIGAAFIAGILTTIVWGRQLLVKRRIVNAIIYAGAFTGTSLTILVLYFRHNPLFTRLTNIFSGADTSAQGRTADSFIIAEKLLHEKNQYWGIGVGQIKILGQDIVSGYYLYITDYVATIPNAMAEILAIFGWIGFSLKLIIEISLFFFTRTWSNYYRLLLFFFMFIYQFTGSFITNNTEYVIWILAFVNVFPQFNVKQAQRGPIAASITPS